jgi:hypothetical protein
MADQAFLNNAKALIMITTDEWTKGFVSSLIEQVNSGRTLSEKQMTIFNAKLDAVLNPPAPVEIDPEFVTKLETLRKKTKSEWLLGFLESLEKQMKAGKALTEKQKDCFQSKYDRLVLKIKPKKVEQDEDVEGIDFESWVSLDDIN